jgi:hypothetical protein
VKCGGMAAAAALLCLSDEEEEEQPLRVRTRAAKNTARKFHPSRMDFMIADLRRDEAERDI